MLQCYPLQLPTSYTKVKEKKPVGYCSWNRASATDIHQYQQVLHDKLLQIKVPQSCLHCDNLLCNKNSILLFNNDIVSACEAAGQITSEAAGQITISSTGPSKCKNVPCWTQTVAPLKEKALFWHRLWKDNGCPRTGQVASIRRCT